MWNLEIARVDENHEETITRSFDGDEMDIHEVLKQIAAFLIAASYAPETVQNGFDRFDINSV